MKQLTLHWFAIGTVFLLITFIRCRTQPVDPPYLSIDDQRASATVQLYLVPATGQVGLDTIHFDGAVYAINAVDSTSFRYDTQHRLVWYQLTQSFRANGKKVTLDPTGQTYFYQTDYMQEGLLRFPLDSTQRRVLSYGKKGYGFIDIDSGRCYSNQGLLLSAFQVRLNPDYSGINNRAPTWKATYKAGNRIQLEVYDYFTGALADITHYFYDDQHRAPLATFTFLGETSHNALLRKTSVWKTTSGSFTTEYLYTNQYDGQGRLVRQLEYQESGTAGTYYRLTKYYY